MKTLLSFGLIGCTVPTLGQIVDSNIPIVLIRTQTSMPSCCPNEPGQCCQARSCSGEDCVRIKEINVNGTIIFFTEGKTAGPTEFYNGTFSIHGQSTAIIFPKQAYNFEPVSELANPDSDYDASILGLPENNKWMFKAPYADQTLMHDSLAFDMFSQTGRYASRNKPVELYLADMTTPISAMNQWDNYQGVYILEEKISRDKHRVDIAKDPDVPLGQPHNNAASGWLLSVDKHAPADPVLPTMRGTNIQIEYPKIYKPDYTEADTSLAETYIMDIINAFETALFSDDFLDPDKGYASHIDFDSFVDYFIHSEMTTSVDAYRYSVYFYKDSCESNPDDCKLKMGPAWDYDLALGMCGTEADTWACKMEYWRYEYEVRQRANSYEPPHRPEGPNTAQWYMRLLSDPQFAARVTYRYNQLRTETLTNEWFDNAITSRALELTSGGAATRNFDRWGTLGQNWVWPYRDIEQNPNRPLPTPETYDDEIANLKRWTLGRLEWLDEAMKGPFMHSYTNVGTACDVRGTYIREFFGPDCAPGCNKDQVDAVQYPTCLRKVDQCAQEFAAGDEGPYGSFKEAGVVNGSFCEFLNYVHLNKPERCPEPLPSSLNPTLFCAGGVCSTEQMPPTVPPTVPPTRTPSTPGGDTPSPSAAPTSPTTAGTTPAPTTPQPSNPTSPEAPTPSAPTQAITRSPTLAPGSSKSSGLGAPGIVAGVAGVLVMVAVGIFCVRRSAKRRAIQKEMKMGLQTDGSNYVPPPAPYEAL